MGLIHYHEALQVVIWPFPFPYAQMSYVLITVHACMTPLVICQWTASLWSCAALTLMSVMCMKGLDLISTELENPFGEDANDLPTYQMHYEMNRDLVLLLNPRTWVVPNLNNEAVLDYEKLTAVREEHR